MRIAGYPKKPIRNPENQPDTPMKRRFLPVFALVLFAVSSTYAQTPNDAYLFAARSPATGPRMMGMAGVGIAGVADYGALRTNPAGLGYFSNSELGGSLHTFSATEDAQYFTGIRTSSAAEADVRATRFSNLAYIQKLPTSQGSFVLGLAFNQVNTFDRNLAFGGTNATSSISTSFLPYADEFTIEEDGDGYSPSFFNDIPQLAYEAGAIEFLFENVGTDNDLFYEAVTPGARIDQLGDVLEKGRTNELNLGGAWEASQGVMVGLAANFAFGSYNFESIYEEADTYNENAPSDYEVALSDGSLFGFNRRLYEERFEADLSGFNLRGGVSTTTLANGLRVGVTLETPTFYEIRENFYRELTTWFDEGGSLDAETNNEYEYELRTPWRIGAGASWEIGSFLLSGDLEYVDWSQMEFDGDAADGDLFRDLNREVRNTMDPVWNMRIGGAYEFGDFTVRGGVAAYPDPFDRNVSRGGGEADRDRRFVSAGASYRFAQNFHLDAGWTRMKFDDQYTPYADVDEPPLVEESVTQHRFLLGVRIGF